jgi:hypothetical protein
MGAAAPAAAGRLFGDIRQGGKPVPPGLLITLVPAAVPGSARPAAAPVDSARTDKVGSYKLAAPAEGKYLLTVHRDEKSATLPVFSYRQATRYDLVLESKDGVLTVRRK